MMRLKGKVALITGGGSGIGLEIAKEYVMEGAYVYITGRQEAKLKKAVEAIGSHVSYIVADVGEKDDMLRAAQKIKDEQGHVDIVMCNAGIGGYVAISDITEKEFDRVMHTNVLGSYFTCQACLPLMREGSTIILNTSVTASLGLPRFSLYIAAKTAMRSFTKTWTSELRERKIRVNAIAPGIIPTPAASGELDRNADEEKALQAYRATLIPAGTVGHVSDIAQAAIYLGSDESRYVNGIELLVDGGLAAVYPVKL